MIEEHFFEKFLKKNIDSGIGFIFFFFILQAKLIYLRPYSCPFVSLVGAPIVCKRMSEPNDIDIDGLRELYKERLTEIFTKYRPLYDPDADDIQFV